MDTVFKVGQKVIYKRLNKVVEILSVGVGLGYYVLMDSEVWSVRRDSVASKRSKNLDQTLKNSTIENPEGKKVNDYNQWINL